MEEIVRVRRTCKRLEEGQWRAGVLRGYRTGKGALAGDGQSLGLSSHTMSPCSQDNMWRCPRRVSTVVCVHEPHCQPPDCSGHGTCVEGRCQCTGHFWQGAACNKLDCGPSNCSQHGLCTESEWGLWGGSCNWGSQLSRPWPRLGPHLAVSVLSWQLAAAVKLDGRGPTAAKVKATRPAASPPQAAWGEGERGSRLYLPPFISCFLLSPD